MWFPEHSACAGHLLIPSVVHVICSLQVKYCVELHPFTSYRGSFSGNEKKTRVLCWADCLFVAQAVVEVPNLLRLCCGLVTVNISFPFYKHNILGLDEWFVFGVTVFWGYGLNWKRVQLECSAAPFPGELASKTVTLPPFQHHIHCQISSDIRRLCCHVILAKCFSYCWIPNKIAPLLKTHPSEMMH